MSKALNKSTAEVVKKILTVNTTARDNDELIHAIIWNKECDSMNVLTRKEFINAYFKKRLTDPNSISRVRRKLQELYPELRGIKWELRQGDYQEKAKVKIKNLK